MLAFYNKVRDICIQYAFKQEAKQHSMFHYSECALMLKKTLLCEYSLLKASNCDLETIF